MSSTASPGRTQTRSGVYLFSQKVLSLGFWYTGNVQEMILQTAYGPDSQWFSMYTPQDWTQLASSIESAYTLLSDLLAKGQAQAGIEAYATYPNWLSSLYFDHRQAEKLRAERNMYLGYPCAVKRQGEYLVAAPLFLWPCRMEPSKERPNGWDLSIAADEIVLPHPYWLSQLADQNAGSTDSDPISWALSQGLRPATLGAMAQQLVEKANWQVVDTQPALTALPKPEDVVMTDCLEDGRVQLIWSALLGNWTPEFASAGSAAALNWREAAPAGSISAHGFSPVALDPCQAQAMAALKTQRHVLAWGGGGSGKTQLAMHLLVNALSNNKPSLLVAKDMAVLEQIRQQLAALGLDHLAFSLRDPQLDKPLLLAQLGALERRSSKSPDYNKQAFSQNIRKLQRQQERLDARFQAVRKRAFGGFSWSDTVGLYLAAARKQSKDQLATQLNPQSFDYSEAEYEMLHTAIQRARPLFEALGVMQHPLSTLNAGIFLHQEEAQSLHFIQSHASQFKEEALRLYSQFIRRSGQYADELQQHHERHYRELLAGLHHLEELLEDSTGEVGEELLKSSRPTLKLYGTFSAKFRDALDRQEQLWESYQQLQALHAQRSTFAFEWPSDAKLARKPAQLRELLVQFAEALENWRMALPGIIQEDGIRLNAKTALPELSVSKHIAEGEQKLENLVESINESGLFQLPLEAKMMTMPRRQKFLEELADKLDNILRNLDNYPAFYAWQRHWFSLPDKCRKVIHALVRIVPADWTAAFDSWYFFQCLNISYDPVPPPPTDSIERYAHRWQTLSELLPIQIRKDQELGRDEALKRLKPLQKEGLSSAQGLDAGWQSLMQKYGADLCRVFPIWLTTPTLAARLIGSSDDPHFDYIVVENAHQLSLTQGQSCLTLARQSLLLADVEQDGLLGTSLVREALQQGVVGVALRHQHRHSAGDIRALLKKTTPASGASAQQVYYTQLDGRYDVKSGTNEAEAQEILRLLNQIQELPQRTYPTVGVATFTRGQRDLILDYLLRIKRQRLVGVELIQQLERNGLGIYSLDELGGQQFDVLLVSGVWGATNLDGDLPAALNEYEQPQYRAQLMGLSSVYRKELHLVSSLSPQVLDSLLTLGHGGLQLLAGFFRYAACASRPAEASAMLALMRRSMGLNTDSLASPLLTEVASRVRSYFPEAEMAVGASWQDVNTPLLLTAEKQKPVVALADGFIAEESATDYHWEWRYTEKLRLAGVALHNISSQDWWKNPTAETVRLASTFRGLMAGEEEE